MYYNIYVLLTSTPTFLSKVNNFGFKFFFMICRQKCAEIKTFWDLNSCQKVIFYFLLLLPNWRRPLSCENKLHFQNRWLSNLDDITHWTKALFQTSNLITSSLCQWMLWYINWIKRLFLTSKLSSLCQSQWRGINSALTVIKLFLTSFIQLFSLNKGILNLWLIAILKI